MELLKQKQYSPMSVERQVAIIFCGTNGLLSKVPVSKVNDFEKQYLDLLEVKHKDVLQQLHDGIITDEIKETLRKEAENLAENFSI